MNESSMLPSHMVVLTIDGLNAGYLGPYGTSWYETPAFNELGGTSLVVEQCVAWHTDLLESLHAVWQPTLKRLGQQPSITTRLLSDDPQVVALGQQIGFDTTHTLEADSPTAAASDLNSTQLSRVSKQASTLVAQTSPATLTWLHLRGLRAAWDAPTSMRENLMDEEGPELPDWIMPASSQSDSPLTPDELLRWQVAYAAQVQVVDDCLGEWLWLLRESGDFPDATLLVTSPRGLPLGSHGACMTPAPLWSTTVQLPCFLNLPHSSLMRTQALTSWLDVHPLLVECVAPQSNDSLLNAIDDPRFRLRDRCLVHSQTPGEHALRTNHWYLRRLASGEHQLYLKPDDRHDVNEISGRLPSETEQLALALDELLGLTPDEQSSQAMRSRQLCDLPPYPEAG